MLLQFPTSRLPAAALLLWWTAGTKFVVKAFTPVGVCRLAYRRRPPHSQKEQVDYHARVSSNLVQLSLSSSAVPSTLPEPHPAVAGWPEKYAQQKAASPSPINETKGAVTAFELYAPPPSKGGPRVLHESFTVQTATDSLLDELDVAHWPTWTTAGNPRWVVGQQRVDKVMPYGELSYMISGQLEIIKPSGERFVVKPGDFVTFPEGFQASWRVLEELTWHYYLY